MPNDEMPIRNEAKKAPARLRSVNTRRGSSGLAVRASMTTNALDQNEARPMSTKTKAYKGLGMEGLVAKFE